MAETLLLAHTMGRKGWDVAHAGGASEFALAAVGRCFVQRRLLFNLTLLWRLRRLWHDGAIKLDARTLRLAMGVDERVRVSGARLDVTITLPSKEGGQPMTLIETALPLAAVRERDARLPALDAGQAWRVYALAADGVKNFRRLARVLASIARDARVELRATARESRSPVALRAAFPLRIELLFDADEGYVTLVPLREIDLTGD
ncbi:MAG: hypothetical protein U5L03_14085 [Burkholderiaceae bacterium]|nr:hypothetical protein [Burkholderiaceae bacterium]